VADAGSVMFQFSRKGVIEVAETGEDTLLTILDAGAEDAVEEDGDIIVYTDQKELAKVRQALISAGLTIRSAELQYVPNSLVVVDNPEVAAKILKLLDLLDDIDDVVNIHTNADITAELPE
jgi:transcriptional/translational regulatory protein YebC/TACO1